MIRSEVHRSTVSRGYSILDPANAAIPSHSSDAVDSSVPAFALLLVANNPMAVVVSEDITGRRSTNGNLAVHVNEFLWLKNYRAFAVAIFGVRP
jgi:hypothetical protein